LEHRTFAELGLSPKVLAAVEAAGYTTPTPIQSEAIPVAVTGRDVLGIAQTGTGKTAGFVLPMITRLETGRARARMPRSLILAPTRELAAQVAEAFEKYGVNHKLTTALLIGGVSFDDQLAKLDRGVDVLIATPGRLLDHFGRGKLMLMGVEILVIDEADRMLDMGFIPDIEKICRLLPPRRQTLFFSATMPPEITRLTQQFLKDPQRIEVAPPATTAKTIIQRFCFCRDGEDFAKREILRKLIRSETVKNAIIFCNRKRDVAILHKSLVKHGFNAGALHGDMDQSARMATLDKFRSGEITLLAASDVAARGLDIPDVSHVFNFDMPWDSDDYVHRIGRTGRAGREGFSIALVTPSDGKILKAVEKVGGAPAEWIGEAPSDADFEEGGKRRRGRGRSGVERSAERRGERGGRGEMGRRQLSPRDGEAGEGPRRERGGRDRDRPRERGPERAERMQRSEHAARPEGPERSTRPERAERPHRDEPRGEGRPTRAQPRGEARPQRHEPRAEARPAAQNESPRQPRMDQQPQRRGAREPHRDREPRRERGGSERPVGFADNVPAFLRHPPRPVKPAKVTT
jgi:superfamily II DNA/RNA helicase